MLGIVGVNDVQNLNYVVVELEPNKESLLEDVKQRKKLAKEWGKH